MRKSALHLLLFSGLIFMLSLPGYGKVLKKVEVSCGVEDCEDIGNRFSDLVGTDYSPSDLRDRLRFKIIDGFFKKFEFRLYDDGDGYVLSIDARRKPIVGEINVEVPEGIDLPNLASYFSLSSGDYFQQDEIVRSLSKMKEYLSERGFSKNTITVQEDPEDNEINLNLKVELGELSVVDSVGIISDNPYLADRVRGILQPLQGSYFDRLSWKLKIGEVEEELRRLGYYGSKIQILDPLFETTKKVRLVVKIDFGVQYAFHLRGSNLLTQEALRSELTLAFKDETFSPSTSSLEQKILKTYQDRGIFNTKVKISNREGVNRSGSKFQFFYINIVEGKKRKIQTLEFLGNFQVNSDELKSLFFDNGTPLIQRNLFDPAYVESFSDVLRRFYLERGFALVNVEKAVVRVEDEYKGSQIRYRVNEGLRVKVDKIEIQGVEQNLRTEILSSLSNKAGSYLNIIEIENDLEYILNVLKEKGYYFSEIENINSDDLIIYNKDRTEAVINVKVRTGKIAIYNSSVVTGFARTKLKVVLREVFLKKGDIVTPAAINAIRNELVALNLFSFVKITPTINKDKSNEDRSFLDLLIELKENKFRFWEYAIGYRTDLGARLSTAISLNNLKGRNWSSTLSLEGNRRVSYGDFDERRQAEQKDLIEYLGKVSFNNPYFLSGIFKKKTALDLSASLQRKRFVSFDADISKISGQLSRLYKLGDTLQDNDSVTLSLKYQYETIEQYDDSNSTTNRDSTIGSFTPSIFLDKRNDPVRPTKGASFSLSWEFANPYFASMDNQDQTINYNRLVSRNKFYFPVSDFLVLALSVSGGIEANLAKDLVRDANGDVQVEDGRQVTKGFIPSTKVFRLEGFDVLRGYSGDESNRLGDGRNIGEVVIDNKAYFLNVKVEPRYFINDSFALGLFYDAGRLYVNKFKPLSMRSSVGLSFKLLTPVGSLDFDYGVKTHRKSLGEGKRESAGRFHLSIGFF